MSNLFLTVLPLNLASTLSPGILALAIILLGSKWHSKARTAALLTGTIIVGVIIIILGSALGQLVSAGLKPTATSAIFDTIIGIIFILFGIKTILIKEKKIKPSKADSGKQIFKWFIIGIVISATNFDAVFLSFTAAKEVSESLLVNNASKALLLFLNLFFFVLPSLLPLVLYIVFPKIAAPILNKINKYVLKYGQYIIFTIFIAFGLILIRQGIIFFL